MKFSHEQRFTAILFQIMECCGNAKSPSSICNDCKERMKKCSRLTIRWAISLPEYAQFVRDVCIEFKSEKNCGDGASA